MGFLAPAIELRGESLRSFRGELDGTAKVVRYSIRAKEAANLCAVTIHGRPFAIDAFDAFMLDNHHERGTVQTSHVQLVADFLDGCLDLQFGL